MGSGTGEEEFTDSESAPAQILVSASGGDEHLPSSICSIRSHTVQCPYGTIPTCPVIYLSAEITMGRGHACTLYSYEAKDARRSGPARLIGMIQYDVIPYLIMHFVGMVVLAT